MKLIAASLWLLANYQPLLAIVRGYRSEYWPHTLARITAVEDQIGDLRKIRYDYRYRGHQYSAEYQEKKKGELKHRLVPGRTLNIFINPSAPSKVVFERGLTPEAMNTMVLSSIFCLLLMSVQVSPGQ